MITGVIVGYGTMGQVHARRFAQLGARIAAIVDPDPERRREAQDHGLQTLVDLAELPPHTTDFTAICTPTHLHHGHLLDSMARDQAIFVEKPVVLTPEECHDLRQIAYARPVFVGEVEQYNPRLRPFLELQERPRTATLSREVNLDLFLHGDRPWFLDEQLSGGIVLDCMIHDINLLVTRFGRPRVAAASGRTTKYGCLDVAGALLHFSDFTARLACRWTGERTDTPVAVTIAWEMADGTQGEVGCDRYAIQAPAPEEDAYLLQAQAFLNTVRSGSPPHPLAAYLDALETALEIRRKIP